jgi:hypothetical protein
MDCDSNMILTGAAGFTAFFAPPPKALTAAADEVRSANEVKSFIVDTIGCCLL